MTNRDEEHDKLVAPADFDGPTGDRHCTDILCLLLLIVVWLGMTGVGLYAVSNGTYEVVLYPLDYDGNICGLDDLEDYPYLYYVNSFTGGICVQECPSLNGLVDDNLTDIRSLVTYNGMWQVTSEDDPPQLPADFLKSYDYSNSSDVQSCSMDTCFPNDDPVTSWTSQGISMGFGYAYYIGDTDPFLNRCYLTSAAEERISEQTSNDGAKLDPVQEGFRFWNSLSRDLWVARYYIAGFGLGMATLLSLIYIFLLRLPLILSALIWLSILVTIAMFFGAGYFAYITAQDWKEQVDGNGNAAIDERQVNATYAGAVILWIIGALLLLLTCCLRKQIQLAIGCVKQAARAVNSMVIVLLVPLLHAVGLLAFLAVLFVYGVFLASLGEMKVQRVDIQNDIDTDVDDGVQVAFRYFEFDDFVYQCAWYLLFCLFWTSNFIVAIGDMIVAMSFAKWYFTREKIRIGSWTVLGSIWDTLFNHMGTCAFGSLVIAVIQFIRAILTKIQKSVKKADNKCADAVLCCCQCCFCLLESCMKFMNKNAYIQTAIFGTPFCKSAREAFFLILRNAGRIGAITYVSAAVLVVGKMFIGALCTGFAYIAIVEYLEEELYNVIGPLVAIFFISYILSDMFMDVFDIGIMTVLHCLVADEEMFSGDQRYSDRHVRSWVDRFGEDD